MADSQPFLDAAQYSGLHQGQPFSVGLQLREPGICLVFSGPVATALPAEAMAAIQKALLAHPGQKAYADLSACNYLGSGAIACLMEYLRLVSPRGLGSIPVVNPHPRAITVLRMLGLANFFIQLENDDAVGAWFKAQGR